MDFIMQSNEIKPLVAYKVTKGSSDGTFRKNDHIWLSKNGDINLAHPQYPGWLTMDEWQQPDIADFEVEPDLEHKVIAIGRSEFFILAQA